MFRLRSDHPLSGRFQCSQGTQQRATETCDVVSLFGNGILENDRTKIDSHE